MVGISTILTIVSICLSVISTSFAVFVGVINMKRNKTTDDKKDATEMTAVIVKLENISNDIRDIKNELKSVRSEIGDLRERVTVAEQIGKSLHKRVDSFEERLQTLEEEMYKLKQLKER